MNNNETHNGMMTSAVASHNLILLDLDGTISNPLQGIGRSINYALTSGGYEPLALADLAKYIGPPLDEIFESLTGNKADTPMLIAHYRQRYGTVGYTENELYPTIIETLNSLKEASMPMAICTSKRQDFAEKILDLFGLAHAFQFVSGGEVGIHKYQQIESLLEKGRIDQSAIMIGDRAVDIIAAHNNGLKAGGALWGYGTRMELLNESPEYLFTLPHELTQLIR